MYGQSRWHHELVCGHTEVRKRKAPAEEIGCLACEAEAEIDEALTVEPRGDDLGVVFERDVMSVASEVALRLGIPADAVSVQMAGTRLQGALILLDPGLVEEILGR